MSVLNTGTVGNAAQPSQSLQALLKLAAAATQLHMTAGPASSRLLGATFVLATVVLWIAASFLAQSLVRPDEWGQPAQLPALLLVYVCTSLFVVYLPILHLKRRWQAQRTAAAGAPQHGIVEGTSWRVALLQTVPIAVIWFVAQYLFTVSLAQTSVTSNTILSSSSCMFTLLASAAVLGEKITIVKLTSVAAVMAGTAMVTVADGFSDDSSHSLVGDALVLCSALCYSCYTVMMRRQLQHDDPDTPALLFGNIGLTTALLGLPVLVVCQSLGSFNMRELQPRALGLAGINGVMDYVLADYTWARAALLLGPTAATLGMNIQVPIATLGDLLLGHPHWLDSSSAVALTTAGTVAILVGVFGINLAGQSSGSHRELGRDDLAEGGHVDSQEPLVATDGESA